MRQVARAAFRRECTTGRRVTMQSGSTPTTREPLTVVSVTPRKLTLREASGLAIEVPLEGRQAQTNGAGLWELWCPGMRPLVFRFDPAAVK